MKMKKNFNALASWVVMTFCFSYAWGITHASDRVSSTNVTRSIVLTQEMFPSLPDLELLETLIVVKASGNVVPFDQMTAPAKATIRRMARRMIPVSGLDEGDPVEILDRVIYPPPLPDDYSIGLCYEPSSLAQRAVRENSFEGRRLSCSVTNVSDIVFSLVVTHAFDRQFCVDSMGNVAVRNQDDPEVKQSTVSVLTLGGSVDQKE